MVNVQLLRREALIVRSAMESCDKGSSTILTQSFPIMNCKFASLLLAFHYFQLLDDTEIICVTGYGESSVSHVWLEIGEYLIDITGDQYNMIDDIELSEAVIKYRAFPKIHIEKAAQSYLPRIFERTERLILKQDFSGFKTSFVSKIKRSHSLLIS